MTERLYSDDPYMQKFESKVIGIKDKKVWLEATCFYPESGGQAGDIGRINNQDVVDTQFDQDKNIVHIMRNDPNFKTGDIVQGEIDWERRHKIMRVHSASHVMEYFLFEVFGELKLIGSHLTQKHDKSTYLSEERLDSNKLEKVEELANKFISENLPIQTWADEKRKYFRHWQCGPIEMPCGGTHPKNTSEIGPIKIKRETGGSGKENVVTSLQNQ